jgi:hypothetical protein
LAKCACVTEFPNFQNFQNFPTTKACSSHRAARRRTLRAGHRQSDRNDHIGGNDAALFAWEYGEYGDTRNTVTLAYFPVSGIREYGDTCIFPCFGGAIIGQMCLCHRISKCACVTVFPYFPNVLVSPYFRISPGKRCKRNDDPSPRKEIPSHARSRA